MRRMEWVDVKKDENRIIRRCFWKILWKRTNQTKIEQGNKPNYNIFEEDYKQSLVKIFTQTPFLMPILGRVMLDPLRCWTVLDLLLQNKLKHPTMPKLGPKLLPFSCWWPCVKREPKDQNRNGEGSYLKVRAFHSNRRWRLTSGVFKCFNENLTVRMERACQNELTTKISAQSDRYIMRYSHFHLENF